MAQLATCPHCDHELLLPEGLSAGASVRCPSCDSSFKPKDAKLREIPAVEVIPPASDEEVENTHAVKTVEDFSSMPTWDSDSADDLELPAKNDLAAANLHLVDHLDDKSGSDELHVDDDLDFGDFDALLETGDKPNFADDEHSKSATPSAGAIPEKSLPQLHVPEADELDTAEPATQPVETPEAAAQRIDAWFRSAKTLADIPALDSSASDDMPMDEPQPKSPAASNNATVDLTAGGIDEFQLSDDFELESPDEAESNGPAWDDPKRMDKLLADFQNESHSEHDHLGEEPSASEAAHDDAVAADWTPDESMKISPPSADPRRKKSLVRTLLMTSVGGLMGLALGYYALLWIRGPEIDVLEAGKYLPQVMLPSSFNKPARQFAAAPVQPQVVEPAETPADETTPPVEEESAKTADTETPPAETPAEQPASFNEPVDATSAVASEAGPTSETVTADKPTEPATFNEPIAEPMKDEAAAVKINFKGTPTFTAADLTAALQAGKEAESGLVNGNLTDGREVARTKGFSYSILADLAQKATFIDAANADEAATLEQETADLFRSALSTPHARAEVAQIVTKWIASPNRRHGGVFFAGEIVGNEAKGSVSEYTVKLSEGETLPVLVSPTLADQLKASTAPVAVVGWIVDKPTDQIEGFTGANTQAIYAGQLIPLE